MATVLAMSTNPAPPTLPRKPARGSEGARRVEEALDAAALGRQLREKSGCAGCRVAAVIEAPRSRIRSNLASKQLQALAIVDVVPFGQRSDGDTDFCGAGARLPVH